MINNSDSNNNNFTIKDNSSDIAPHLPSYMREPLTILARIRNYKGIDDYVINIVQDDLESIKLGGQGVQDLGEGVIKYLERLGITDDDIPNNKEDLK